MVDHCVLLFLVGEMKNERFLEKLQCFLQERKKTRDKKFVSNKSSKVVQERLCM